MSWAIRLFASLGVLDCAGSGFWLRGNPQTFPIKTKCSFPRCVLQRSRGRHVYFALAHALPPADVHSVRSFLGQRRSESCQVCASGLAYSMLTGVVPKSWCALVVLCQLRYQRCKDAKMQRCNDAKMQ